jgi:predicted adenylyl cyclase CyaB
VRNLEFKTRLEDPKAALARARELGAELWGDLRQTDTYFNVASGRLKLRETAGLQAELIHYARDEAAADRPSDYEIARTPDPKPLLEVLSRSLGVLAVVKKRRTLVTLDTTRIHLDNVEQLGSFLEIEVIVGEDEAAAKQRFDLLLEGLGYTPDEGIRASYLDLLLAHQRFRPSDIKDR